MRCDGLIRTERARMPRARASARAWRVAWQTALSRLGRLPSALRSARPPPVRAERLKLLRALRAFSSPLERACACVSAPRRHRRWRVRARATGEATRPRLP